MKTTILFGAGADSLYGICTGETFSGAILKSNYRKERKALLESYNEYSHTQLIHKNSKKVFLQTIYENRKEAELVFGIDKVNKYINEYQKSEPYTKETNDFCINMYNKITNFDELSIDEEALFFIKNARFFDVLDEKFNSLRLSSLNSFSKRVINTYWIIYILLLKELYKNQIGYDFKWKKENILNLLNESYDIDSNKYSYYKIIFEIINKDNLSKEKYALVTTNYTSILENVVKNKPIYLHGNMNWFEDYKTLQVEDSSYFLKKDYYDSIMPFIMIPSGVKPLICKKQIKEFNKFIDQLELSNILLIVGYKFNSEDNHINSLIGNWLRNNENKMVYMNYKGECELDKLTWLSHLGTYKIDFDLSSRIDEKMFAENSIVNIKVEKNSLKCFEKIIEIIERGY